MRLVAASCPTDTVYVGLAMDAGTRDEEEKESGMAHFAEHLSFKGTTRRTSRQIITRMESVGGDMNAFTGKEETVYYCTCRREHFGRAVDLLFDIVFNSTYPREAMEKEAEVVTDEIESYNDSPSELIYDDFEAMLFHGHPLGRNILGDADRLRQYDSTDVARYTGRLYIPERAALFVYGNIAIPEILRHIPDIPAAAATVRNAVRTMPDEEYRPEEKVICKDTHQTHIMMGARAYGGSERKRTALLLANNILGGPGLSSRLNLALREKRGLVYTVESTLTTYTDAGLWAVYFGCDHKDAAKCKRLVRNELRRLCDAPLPEKTLNAAKRQLTGQIALSYDNFESVAIGMGKRMLHYNRTQTGEEMIQAIRALTPEQVWEAAREVFNPERLTILEYR
ncbi:MAG: insulinase family protein [Bacteroidaceae bacterium]|nr:insulinase family protein [Bacteroidaceae bacterium]